MSERVTPAVRAGRGRPAVSAFNRVVPQVAPHRPGDALDRLDFRWANVASLRPLTITFPDAAAPAEGSPLCAGNPNDLRVGQKVGVLFYGGTMFVLPGATAGDSSSGAWQELPIAAPWTSYSAFGALVYRLADGGMVQLSGAARNGTGGPDQPIAILPPEARPVRTKLVTSTSAYGTQLTYIHYDGRVYINTPMAGANWVSLENVQYRL